MYYRYIKLLMPPSWVGIPSERGLPPRLLSLEEGKKKTREVMNK